VWCVCVLEGTPLSYATADHDNELALTDCNGFVVYVAGEDEVTDVGVADGAWHHVTVTWSSHSGLWNIYRDGQRLDGGRGLAAGRHIAGSTPHVTIRYISMRSKADAMARLI